MTTNEPPGGPDPQEPQEPQQPAPPPPPAWGESSYPPPPGDSGGGAGGGWGSGGGYPPPPPPGDSGFVPPFSAPDAIGYGWRRFTGNLGQWLLAGLAIVAVSIAFAGLSWLVQPDISADETNPFAGFSLAGSIVNLASTIVGYIITAVMYRGALDECEGRKFSVGDTLSRVPIVPVILTSLLIGIGVTVGLLLCIIPGLVFAFLSFFALMFVVDRGESPVEAIRSSISLVASNVGNALLLALLCFLLIIVGFCLCCVGLFVAYPVVTIATAYAYKRFQDQPVA